jgi:hypothetical protein
MTRSLRYAGVIGLMVLGTAPLTPQQNGEQGTEPPAKLIVDPPIPLALAHGVALIQYRAENVHIVPVFGPAALKVFPRVGHLHINVDDLPWHWADASDTGTIDVKDLPPGQHKITNRPGRRQPRAVSRTV